MELTAADQARAARRAALLAALGDPQRGLAVVNVAGTNGKGSVVAMLAAILHAAGLRVGRFTSPDLHGPHERFWLDGVNLTPAELAAREAALAPAFQAAEAAFPGLGPLGAFERWCAVAWTWLAERGCDVAVVEAGVGGLTDATNVFERPLLTLVTNVGLDHTERLGPDVAAIARHKAGLFRPGVPAFTGATGEALAALRAEAVRRATPLAVAPPLPADVPVALPGAFQRENAALAVAAAEALAARGLPIAPAHVRAGLAAVAWPGRLETLPDPAGGAWLLDGAHNPPAVAALAAAWADPAVVVAGFRADKAAGPMVAALTAGGRPLVVSPVPGAPSWQAADLAADAAGEIREAPDVAGALAQARALAPDGVRAVTGSLWLVGAARAVLLDQLGLPLRGLPHPFPGAA